MKKNKVNTTKIEKQPQPGVRQLEDKELLAADGAYFAPACRDCACTNTA